MLRKLIKLIQKVFQSNVCILECDCLPIIEYWTLHTHKRIHIRTKKIAYCMATGHIMKSFNCDLGTLQGVSISGCWIQLMFFIIIFTYLYQIYRFKMATELQQAIPMSKKDGTRLIGHFGSLYLLQESINEDEECCF